MDELFSKKQDVSTTALSTTTAGNHLASIATTMLTTLTGLTSKNAANYANANREETIDYNDIPTDVGKQCALNNHSEKVILIGDMKPYQNNLTMVKHGAKREWRMVEYLAIGTDNTTKHDDQMYVIMSDGILYSHLGYQ